MAVYGYVWLSRAVYGCVWLWMSVYSYVCLYRPVRINYLGRFMGHTWTTNGSVSQLMDDLDLKCNQPQKVFFAKRILLVILNICAKKLLRLIKSARFYSLLKFNIRDPRPRI